MKPTARKVAKVFGEGDVTLGAGATGDRKVKEGDVTANEAIRHKHLLPNIFI